MINCRINSPAGTRYLVTGFGRAPMLVPVDEQGYLNVFVVAFMSQWYSLTFAKPTGGNWVLFSCEVSTPEL